MWRQRLLGLVLVLAGGCGPTQVVVDTGPIDVILKGPIEAGRLVGVAAMAASGDGVLYQGAFGKKNRESGEPMAVDTLFGIASMTKAITSTAAMQLVEQGKIKLDEPAQTYLPELADVRVMDGFEESGEPKLRAPATAVTVRQLLSHTGGYAYPIWNADVDRYERGRELPPNPERVLQAPMVSDPGTRWEYGINIDVIGIMVERISGRNLEQYFRENIFEPLGMKSTWYQIPDSEWHRMAGRYSRDAGGGVAAETRALPASSPKVEFFNGGGGLTSTVGDYTRFMRAILNEGTLDGKTILTPESVALMAQNQVGGLQAGLLKSVRPDSSNDVDFFPGAPARFGLGFLINVEPVAGRRSAGSLAWAGFQNTYFWIDPAADRCGVLMTQMLPFGDTGVLETLVEFERAVYAAFGRE